MTNKIILTLSLILTILFFNTDAAAQTVGEATDSVANSNLTKINLSSGARRIKNGMTPAEVTSILRRLIEQGGSRVRQGKSETIIWGGNYQSAKGAQMIRKLETELRGADWEYETAAQEQGVTFFTLLRETPDRRALVGFFAPSKESFIFAVTEMLPAGVVSDAPEEVEKVEPTETPAKKSSKNSKISGGANSSKIVGSWFKSRGAGGSRDHTGKTLYNSGDDLTFEFYADGTMMFINDKNTLSITQCTITQLMKIPGTYSVSGDTLTMNLGAGTVVGTDSCSKAGNFKKNLTPDTMTKTFVVKNLESVFRPDAPLILCFDGAKDDDCLERTNK